MTENNNQKKITRESIGITKITVRVDESRNAPTRQFNGSRNAPNNPMGSSGNAPKPHSVNAPNNPNVKRVSSKTTAKD